MSVFIVLCFTQQSSLPNREEALKILMRLVYDHANHVPLVKSNLPSLMVRELNNSDSKLIPLCSIALNTLSETEEARDTLVEAGCLFFMLFPFYLFFYVLC